MGIAHETLAGRRVAVLGAGGAARAIVAALARYRADVTIYNRTVARGERLAEEFCCAAAGRDALDALEAEIVVNCTPLGMHPNVDATPLQRVPPSVRVVFDTIYNPVETLLLQRARAAGCTCVAGLDMFVNQAAAQFEAWTTLPAPRDAMRAVVVRWLTGGGQQQEPRA
jgi:3-dehydroquinate dehydratase/shikimate dehydrogenase